MNDSILQYCGKILTITEVDDISYEIDGTDIKWIDDWFECKVDDINMIDDRNIQDGISKYALMLESDKERMFKESGVPVSSLNTEVGGSHYQMPIKPVDFIIKNDIPFAEGNVIKYVCWHRKKNGAEDIRKAIQYLEFILEHEYNVKRNK